MIHSGFVPFEQYSLASHDRDCRTSASWRRYGKAAVCRGTHRPVVVEWWFCSTLHECIRLLCGWSMAFGNPVVPDEKYMAASSESVNVDLRSPGWSSMSVSSIVTFCKGRAVFADVVHQIHSRHPVAYLLHTTCEFRAEHDGVHFRQVTAVAYFVRRVAEVQRHCQSTCLEDTEIDRQPLDAVHQEDSDFVAFSLSLWKAAG